MVRVSARAAGNRWEISVTDNGIGIAPEFVDKVFVIFQRLHPKDAYPGTGIGLAIAKKIVEYHGGQIWIDTGYTEGTRVVFTLPAPVPPPAEPAQEPAPEPAQEPPAAEAAGAAEATGAAEAAAEPTEEYAT